MASRAQEPIIQARPRGEKRRGNLSLWLFISAVLLSLITVPFYLLRPRTQTYLLRSFETATVNQGDLTDWLRASGTVTPKLERSVLAPADGVLAEWQVAEGDEVTAGNPLGVLSSRRLKEQLSEAEKELRAAELALDKLRLEQTGTLRASGLELDQLQTSLSKTEAELSVAQRLYDAGAASRNELVAAQTAFSNARAGLNAKALEQQDAGLANELALQEAQLRLELAKDKLLGVQIKEAGLSLSAPVTGRVMKLALAPGSALQEGVLLATVASSEELRAIVKIPEAQSSRLSPGQTARLRVSNEEHKGSVLSVSPNAEAGQNGPVVAVTLGFEGDTGDIRIGAAAAADIEVAKSENALYLPRGAFLSTGGERFVYLVEGGAATRTVVAFGLVDGNRVEIKDGLKAGDKIISSSYEAFKDRETIELAPEGEIK